jgi:hypothetical protein
VTELIRKKIVGDAWGTAIETGGGSQLGVAIVRGPFSFAFDTPGLTDGVIFYTPTVDDVLLNVWFEIDTVFDGTTPQADVGTFVGTNSGLWAATISRGFSLTDIGTQDAGTGLYLACGFHNITGAGGIAELYALGGDAGENVVPGRFTATNPLKLVVSQNGQKGGAAVGGTMGAARLYIVTATPLAF